jgi:hypothetical protein
MPNSITHLTFGEKFNQKILPGTLPNSITHLTFGYWFNQEILPDILPQYTIIKFKEEDKITKIQQNNLVIDCNLTEEEFNKIENFNDYEYVLK